MGKPAVPALIQALTAEPPTPKWAAWVLGEIGDPAATEPLKKAAERDVPFARKALKQIQAKER